MAMFLDAFLGSGVPLSGDPITSFQNVPLLGLRTATILNNCKLMVQDVVKARFIATNCGERRLEIILHHQDTKQLDRDHSEDNVTTLLPGESLEYTVFRSWDAPGAYQLTLAYQVHCAGHPFARLTFPGVAIHVKDPEANNLANWIVCARAARLHPR